MTRKMSASGVLRSLVDAGVLPDEAVVMARKGRAEWSERGLQFVVMINEARGPVRGMSWALFVGDGSELGDFFGLNASFGVRLIGDDKEPPLPWPTGSRLSEGDLERLRALIEPARQFVSDRADFAWVYRQEHDVARGAFFAWLPGYPARLVKSLLLAQDMGDEAAVAEVRAELRSGRGCDVGSGVTLDIMVVAQRWAKEIGKDLGRPIEL